jgi:hypothetical protein
MVAPAPGAALLFVGLGAVTIVMETTLLLLLLSLLLMNLVI